MFLLIILTGMTNNETTQENGQSKRSTRAQGLTVTFKPGQAVLVQALGDNQRYWGRILGHDPYDYFLVKLPLVPGILRLASPGASLTVRLETDGELFGFGCDVISATHKPYPMLILSYPTTTERLQLRRHKRVKCLIPALVENEFFKSPAFIVDLSKGGCKLVLDVFQKQKIINLMTGDDVAVSVSLDSMTNMRCKAKVMSLSELRHGRALGASFDSEDEESLTTLRDFMERLEVIDSLVEHKV